MEEILRLMSDFESRNNMEIAFTMHEDGSYSVYELWDNERLDGGISPKELIEFLQTASYKLDEKGRCYSPFIRID